MTQPLLKTEEAARLAGVHSLLQEKMLFWMPDDGDYCSTLLHGFSATRREHVEPAGSSNSASWPVIELVVQGCRCIEIGGKKYYCDERNCYIGGMEVTEANWVTAASGASPYLSISLGLDSHVIQSLIMESRLSPFSCAYSSSSVVAQADMGMLDAFLRLISLIYNPEMFFCLAPFIVKEIHYRMLIGPVGESIYKFHMRQNGRAYNTRDCKFTNVLTLH